MNAKYYTVQQIAVELGVSYDTVRYMIHSGQLKAFKVGTGKTRSSYQITEEAFQEYKRGEVKS